MAPEQLEGKEADARTDIFAFGSVLYEMVTGKRAFEGKSQASLIAAILERQPTPINEIERMTPPALDHLVKRCLEKDPDERWQAVHDVMKELKWITESSPQAGVSESAITVKPKPWKRVLTLAVAILVSAVITGIAFWSLMPRDARTVKRFSITGPEVDELVVWESVALSADGGDLIVAGVDDGVQRLYRRSMDQLDVSPIRGTEGGGYPFLSPDGEWLGFFADGQLKKVPLAGGQAVSLCEAAEARGGSWGLDDTITFASTTHAGLMQVKAAGGESQPITTPDTDQAELSHWWPDALPGGKAVIFTVWYGSLETAKIAAQSLETGERKMLLEGTYPQYVPTGHIVFARERSLWAVPFDAKRLEVTGSPTPVVESPVLARVRGGACYAIGSEGSLVYARWNTLGDSTLVWVDRNGVAEPVPVPPRAYRNPRISSDGKLLAVLDGGDRSGDIWIYDIFRGTPIRLTFTGGNQNPVWTPDGKRIAFSSNRSGSWNVFWKPADGSGEAEQLTTGELAPWATSMSPNGKFLAFHQNDPRTSTDIWVLPLVGERRARPFLQTPFVETCAVFSPDGHWLAYESYESGRAEIYVRPYPGPGGKWQVSTEGGIEPMWARNGKELFFRNEGNMMVADITAEEGFTAGNPRVLFDGRRFRSGGWPANYDVSPDGERFVMVQGQSVDAQLNVVLNWFEELKRLAPKD
jgi:serine/threonine-protein kinase